MAEAPAMAEDVEKETARSIVWIELLNARRGALALTLSEESDQSPIACATSGSRQAPVSRMPAFQSSSSRLPKSTTE